MTAKRIGLNPLQRADSCQTDKLIAAVADLSLNPLQRADSCQTSSGPP